MYDRSDLGLRGPVKSCRSEQTLSFRRCGADACDTEERCSVTTTEYDSEGQLLRQWCQNPNASEWTAVYTYDQSGRLPTIATDGTAGTPEIRTHYYDQAGRLERIGLKTSDSAERTVESFKYDCVGRKTKVLHIDLSSRRPDTTYGYGVEGTTSAYSAVRERFKPGMTSEANRSHWLFTAMIKICCGGLVSSMTRLGDSLKKRRRRSPAPSLPKC